MPSLTITQFVTNGSDETAGSAMQDSPPAAGRFSGIIPLRRSAILPGGFFILVGNPEEFPTRIKKPPLQNIEGTEKYPRYHPDSCRPL